MQAASEGLPPIGQIADELLVFLSLQSRSLRAGQVYGPLAERMRLTPSQRALKRATTDELLWHNYVQSARNFLCDKELMPRKPHNTWRLTDAGLKEAKQLERGRTVTAEDLGL